MRTVRPQFMHLLTWPVCRSGSRSALCL